MHSSRMRTARSLIVSPYLVISHTLTPLPPRATTHPRRTTTQPPPRSNHTCPPEQPCMPPQSNHAHPPGATMHALPSNHAHPTPDQPPPRSNHARPPPVNRMTNGCKNITLPQTSFAGGNKEGIYKNRLSALGKVYWSNVLHRTESPAVVYMGILISCRFWAENGERNRNWKSYWFDQFWIELKMFYPSDIYTHLVKMTK